MDPEIDFESKIVIKINAPQILRKELSNPKWKNELVNLGSVCDPYQAIEKKYEITKKMLEVFSYYKIKVILFVNNDNNYIIKIMVTAIFI